MTATIEPKAFISHASEDKDRFVLGFARKLRENGVDAWYDFWEIQPGDSLVQKIFDEGIGEADTFFVILSQNSVKKPWVLEELDSAIVKRINQACRIIPIVLDDCEVPTALKHLLWMHITNLESYDTEFSRILNTVFGGSEKPRIGSSPPMANQQSFLKFPGLTKADNLVLQVAGNECLKTGRRAVNVEEQSEKFQQLGLSQEEVSESLEVLEARFYLDSKNSGKEFDPDSGTWEFRRILLNKSAVIRFAQQALPDYQRILKETASAIVNKNLTERQEILDEVAAEAPIMEFVMSDLENRGHIHLLLGSNGLFHCVRQKSPELKRMLA